MDNSDKSSEEVLTLKCHRHKEPVHTDELSAISSSNVVASTPNILKHKAHPNNNSTTNEDKENSVFDNRMCDRLSVYSKRYGDSRGSMTSIDFEANSYLQDVRHIHSELKNLTYRQKAAGRKIDACINDLYEMREFYCRYSKYQF